MRFKQHFFSLKSNIFFIITSKRKCLIEVYYDPILRKNFPDKRVRPKRREPCRHATCRQKSDPIHHRHNKQKEHSSKTHHSCTKHANMFIFNFLYLFVIFVILIFAPLLGAERVSPQSRLHKYFDVNANAKNRISHYRELYAPKVYLQGKYKPYFGPQSFYRLLIFR